MLSDDVKNVFRHARTQYKIDLAGVRAVGIHTIGKRRDSGNGIK